MGITRTVRIRRVIIQDDEPVFSISVASRLTTIPAWTLRMLDKNRIVCPHKSGGNTRLYSHEDLSRLQRIHDIMQQHAINIRGLKILQKLTDLLEE